MIAIVPPSDPEPLRRAARDCNNYDWIIFSSANAVEAFAAQLNAPPRTARIATVGSATRSAAETHGFIVSVTPDDYIAEGLVAALGSESLHGKRILIPSAAVTRDVIPAELRARGARVDVVEAYRNVLPSEGAEQAPRVFKEPYPDIVLFASSSAAANLISLVGSALRNTKLVSIGPATSATLRNHGFEPAAEARTHTAEGLIDACVMMQTSQS